MIVNTWYVSAKMEREAMDPKQGLLLAALATLLWLPLDKAVTMLANKMRVSKETAQKAMTDPGAEWVWEQARQILAEKDSNPQAAQLVDMAEAEARGDMMSPLPDDGPETVQQPAQTNAVAHNILARTIWAEGLSEGEDGMRAIASVIYNRGGGKPAGMVKAVKAPRQFSCWNSMDWRNFKVKEKSGAPWEVAKAIASELLSGSFSPTTNATHYYNPDKVTPGWSKGQEGKTIGRHRFMSL